VTPVRDIDARMAAIWGQRDVCGKARAIALINDLLDTRLRATRPQVQYEVCKGCRTVEVAAIPVRCVGGGVTYVTLCPSCDYSKCSGCGQMILDRQARCCPTCRSEISFTPVS
jgi:hypothetical protein